MKTLPRPCAAFVLGFGLLLSASPCAHAEITVDSTSSFGNVTIDPSAGNVSYIGLVGSSAYAQAGGNGQFDPSNPALANATDIPVAGATVTGSGSASGLALTGSAAATGLIPAAMAGFDASTGRGTVDGEFEITGATAPVQVSFSALFNGSLNLSADAYGVFGQGETDFSFTINGTPVLFADEILSVGPNQSQSDTIANTLTGSMTLEPNTPYSFVGEADAEANVINGTTSAVPEPSDCWLLAEGLALVGLFSSRRRRWLTKLCCAGIAGLAATAHATYIGADAPHNGGPSTYKKAGKVSASLTEGNIRLQYTVPTPTNAPGLFPFFLTYNSYDADGSKAQLNTGFGFGWTSSYNTLLFQQRGQIFRINEDGDVTQFYLNYNGSGGTYSSDNGDFETLTLQPDGTYYVTNKDQTWWHYGLVPNTPFLIAGPVYRLLDMGDRNDNVTSMTYANGLLQSTADPYGRTTQYTYNPANELSSVTDPMGRTTTFQYDPSNRVPTSITDPLGQTTRYTYNAEYQMTREVDPDGRIFFYTYKDLKPYMVTDGDGDPYFSLDNPDDWAVNQTNLTYSLERTYVPSTTTSTDGNGNIYQYTYNTNGDLTQVTDPLGGTFRYTYDPTFHEVTSTTDPAGRVTTFQYNSGGDLTETTDPMGLVTTYTYDPTFHVVTSETDPRGFTTTYDYDSHGNRIEEMDAIGNSQFWTYDSHGHITSYTDANGYTTTYTYDSDGDRIGTTDPLANTTQSQYDADGNCIETIDPLGHITRYQYDADNRLIQTTDALGDSSTTVYDGAGDITSTTDPDGHTTTYQYDVRNRLVETIDPLGAPTTTTYDADDNRISTTDPMGRMTTTVYDEDDRRIAVIDPLGHATTTAYDPDGNVIERTSPDGNTTTYQYDPDNRQTSVTDALGFTSRTQYDPDGNAVETIDPNGFETQNQYDADDRRIEVIDPLGFTTRTQYDADGNVISRTDADGHTTQTQYDADNRQIQVIDPLGNVTRTLYDADGNVIEVTDANNYTTRTEYDPLNRQIETIDPLGGITSTLYDADGNVTETIDANDNITRTEYDPDNRAIQVIDPLSNVTRTFYDADGEVIEQIDPDGNVTSTTYDPDSRQIGVTNAIRGVTTTTYDADGNVLSVTDPDGNTTTYYYDALDRQIAETDPVTIERSQTFYDADGNVIRTIDAEGNETTYYYDALNRRIGEQDSGGPVSSTTYDGQGNVLMSIDGDGHAVTYTYDEDNRRTSATDSLGDTSYSEYDGDGNVISTTDGDGNTTTYYYDGNNRQIQTEDSLFRSTTTTYDADGNTISTTDENGHTTTYTYDGLNRISTETYPDKPPRTMSYTYDADGEIIMMIDQDAQVTEYNYDALGLETIEQYQSGGLSDTFTYDAAGRVIQSQRGSWIDTYTYDSDGRLVSTTQNGLTITYTYNAPNGIRTITYPSGRVITEQYDERNRLISISDGTNPPIATYTYDSADRLISRTYRNGVQTTYTYDNNNRVISIQHSNGSTVIAEENYSYDDEGNKLYEQKIDEPGSSESYMYDSLNRLTDYREGSLSGGTVPSPVLEHSWSYDAVGNWLSVTSNSYTEYNNFAPDNELIATNGQYLYDADGSLVQSTYYTYAYDEEHRLTNVVRRSDSVDVGQYFYDAMGREVMKITDASGTPTTNVYYYDEDRLIEERDGSGGLVATYTYDADNNQVQTMDRAGHTYYYQENAHESPYVLTDTNGVAVERYQYDAYGEPTIMDGNYNPLPLNTWGTVHSAVSNAWLFIGRQFNEESGLYTYFSRVYDAIQGRYLQRDSASQGQATNRYEYASDNPTTSTNATAGRRVPSWWPYGDGFDEWDRRPIVDEWDRIIGWEHRGGMIEIVPREPDLEIQLDRGIGDNCARNRNLYEIGFMVGREFVPGYCVLRITCKRADGQTATVTATIIGTIEVCAPSEGAAKAPGIVFQSVAAKVNRILQQLRDYYGLSAQIESIKFRDDNIVARKIADGCCDGLHRDGPAVSLQVPESLFTGRPTREGHPPELGYSLGEYFLRTDRPHGGLVFDSDRDLPINRGIDPR